MNKIEKILIPLDLTIFSVSALRYALDFAKLYDAAVYVLNVFDNSPYEIIPRKSPEMDELFYSVEENAKMEMNKFIRNNLENSIKLIQVIKCGKVENEIVKFADEENIDLIIIVSYNKHGVLNPNSDSISNLVIRQTDIPVMLINNNELKNCKNSISLDESKYQLNNFGKYLFN